jgi:hypothetical protein
MRANRVAWGPAAMLAAMVLTPVGPASAQGPFGDVPARHPAYAAVNELAKQGFVNGYPDSRFRGNQPMTRYEVAMVVQRILQQPLHRDPTGPVLPRLPTTAREPVDVPASHWAADAVTDAHRWGLLIGYPGPTFAGDRPITRGEFDALLQRLRTAALQRLEQQGFAKQERATAPPRFLAAVGLSRPLTRYEFCVGLQRLIVSLQHVVEEDKRTYSR